MSRCPKQICKFLCKNKKNKTNKKIKNKKTNKKAQQQCTHLKQSVCQ